MTKEVRTILETVFSPDQIKSRKGLWGRTLDYIEGHSVISRLNEAFESDWSFFITQYKVLEDDDGDLPSSQSRSCQKGCRWIADLHPEAMRLAPDWHQTEKRPFS